MKLISTLLGLFIAAAALAPVELAAYPGFGKKIDASLSNSCGKCHVVYPKLRAYGKTVREIGYNVPSGAFDDGGLKRLYRSLPLALRGKVDMFNAEKPAGVNLSELQLISGGNTLSNKLSWWFHKHVMEDNELVSLTTGMPHEAWLQFNASDAVHLRAGMFELPLWFSWSKTKVSELDYLYYTTTTNSDNFGLMAAPQFGLQAYGTFAFAAADEDDWGEVDDTNQEGYNYALSLTNGETAFTPAVNTFFGRITRKKPDYAVGLFMLAGIQAAPAEDDHGDDAMAHAEEQGGRYYRLGADGELYLRGDDATVYASAAYGQDVERAFVGGFVGYDQLVGRKIFLTARLDGVRFTAADEHAGMDMTGEEDGAHIHGTVISDNALAACFGLYYLAMGNLRLGIDYRYGLTGIDNKSMLQLQFAL
ncbi:MAG: hypothetical protein IH971_10595 [Candidatus Marinimicrobia bacterium]|nr:hypothetical protein [Candidatus Neomarinimicrobiota bacterium]